jgi:hypothetical protein
MARPRPWPLVTALTRFWADDRGLSVFTVLLLVVIFVLPPLMPPGTGRSRVGDLLYALLLLSGVLASRPPTQHLLLPAAAVTIAAHFASWFLPLPEPWVLGRTSCPPRLPGWSTRPARRSRDLHRIQGRCRLPASGPGWGHAYAPWPARDRAPLGALSALDGPGLYYQLRDPDHRLCDVLPSIRWRSLAILEAVTGPLYLAILVARLVCSSRVGGDEGGLGEE